MVEKKQEKPKSLNLIKGIEDPDWTPDTVFNWELMGAKRTPVQPGMKGNKFELIFKEDY